MSFETSPKMHVIDLSHENLKPDSSSQLSTCREIWLALEQYRCFVASYDKLSSEFQKQVFDALKELFDLPQETKMKNGNPKPGHGYMGKIPTLPPHGGMGIEYPMNLEECQKFATLMWPEGNEQKT